MQTDDFHVFDTTLRDGAQREGITYSVADKLAVARLLDQLGVGFIEGGWPGAMPKDTEFFARAADGELTLKNATLVAFGSTRKAGVAVQDDPQVRALLDSRAPVVTLVAKSSVWHVTDALHTTLEENLAMVHDTVAFLRAEGRRVFVDCEHFFDGYRLDPDYGVRLLDTAAAAGADVGVLCDTNGGMLPSRRARRRHRRRRARRHPARHPHPGRHGLRGREHVRRGRGRRDARPGDGERIRRARRQRQHLQRPRRTRHQDGAGRAAATGASPRCSASRTRSPRSRTSPRTRTRRTSVRRRSRTRPACTRRPSRSRPAMYNHLDPAVVGNDQRILVTEMAGRASVELKAGELGVDVTSRPDVVGKVVERVKQREAEGWSYEAADASFELLLRDELGRRRAAVHGSSPTASSSTGARTARWSARRR